jgi:hypothetical protein
LGEVLTTPHRINRFSYEIRTLASDLLVRPKQRKSVIRFGTWNVRSLYRLGSITAVARELVRYKLHIVGVQEVRWEEGGTVRIGDHNFFCGKE